MKLLKLSLVCLLLLISNILSTGKTEEASEVKCPDACESKTI
jgi:hypothetical protein